jgi:protein TonB
MFDQTFVTGSQDSKKPLTLLVSTLIQLVVLCVLFLVPVIYTATLPSGGLKSLLIAPPPPLIAVKPSAPKAQANRMIRVLNSRVFAAPVAIPKQVTPIDTVGAPPDIAAIGTTGPADDALGSDRLGSQMSIPIAPPPIERPKAKPAVGPVRIGSGVAEANLISKVIPPYPPLAKATRVQGAVEFTATISKNGNIENLRLVRGHPLLVNAAREAVMQWKYRPTLLNGQAVEVLTDIVVNFTLCQ